MSDGVPVVLALSLVGVQSANALYRRAISGCALSPAMQWNPTDETKKRMDYQHRESTLKSTDTQLRKRGIFFGGRGTELR
nr:hypothetical protein Itr_chr03CG26070 [Ipomoea trifida]